MIHLQTPLKTFAAAAVLLDRDGDIFLLEENGDYAPTVINLHHYSTGGLSHLLVYADAGDEPLFLSHDGTELSAAACQKLGFRPYTSPPGFEIYRAYLDDGGSTAGVALLHDGSWHTASDAEGPELLIGTPSFFSGFGFTGRQQTSAAPGPRARLSTLASRALA